MENKEYTIGTKVIMKKQHPCGANSWEKNQENNYRGGIKCFKRKNSA